MAIERGVLAARRRVSHEPFPVHESPTLRILNCLLEHGDAAVASQCRDPGRLCADSLPTDTLALFWTEVREIAAELQPETVALIQVDAAVQDAAIHASGDLPERIAIKGRGGTDFRPGFAWLSEQGLRLGCCPYLTDIKCDRYPEAEPDYPVVQLGSAARRAQPPTLGRAHRHGGAMRLCVSAAARPAAGASSARNRGSI